MSTLPDADGNFGLPEYTPPTPEQVHLVLGDLRPSEIVELYGIAYTYDHDRDSLDPETCELIKAYEERLAEDPVCAIADAIITLASIDPPRLEAIAVAFANSPDEVNRNEFAHYIVSDVARVSPKLGVSLWDRLLRDEDEHTRLAARLSLNDVVGDRIKSGITDEALLEETGVSREQYYQLVAANNEANRGNNIFNLGRHVLRQLVDQSDVAGEGRPIIDEAGSYRLARTPAGLLKTQTEG